MNGYPQVVQSQQGVKFKLLYNEAQIDQAVDQIMQNVNHKINSLRSKDPSAKVLIVGILNGAFMITAAICRRLQADAAIEFIKCRSYKGQSSGQLEIISDFKWQLLHGAYVLIVDDICDTGKTLAQLTKVFQEKGALEVQTCVLIQRPDKQHAIIPNYTGLTCSAFIVGYGLDFNQFGRHYPCIYQKVEE